MYLKYLITVKSNSFKNILPQWIVTFLQVSKRINLIVHLLIILFVCFFLSCSNCICFKKIYMKNSFVYDEMLKLFIQNTLLNTFYTVIFQYIYLDSKQMDFLYSPIHGIFRHKIKIVIHKEYNCHYIPFFFLRIYNKNCLYKKFGINTYHWKNCVCSHLYQLNRWKYWDWINMLFNSNKWSLH